jgi:hypothetical protein
MYVIEVWNGKWGYQEIARTKRPEKHILETEVEDLNKNVPPEQLRLMPVRVKYRVKKIKNFKSTKNDCDIKEDPVSSD